MLYVEEQYKNISDKYQWRTLLKTNDFEEAEKFVKNYDTVNRVEVGDTYTGTSVMVKNYKIKSEVI